MQEGTVSFGEPLCRRTGYHLSTCPYTRCHKFVMLAALIMKCHRNIPARSFIVDYRTTNWYKGRSNRFHFSPCGVAYEHIVPAV